MRPRENGAKSPSIAFHGLFTQFSSSCLCAPPRPAARHAPLSMPRVAPRGAICSDLRADRAIL